MLKIYAGYFYASFRGGLDHAPLAVTAYSWKEAKEHFFTTCHSRYPREEGYRDQDVSFIEIPESMIQACLEYR